MNNNNSQHLGVPSQNIVGNQNHKYVEFHDEENQQKQQQQNDTNRSRRNSSKYSSQKKSRRRSSLKKKSKLEKMMTSDKANIYILDHTPFHEDFEQQSKTHKAKTIITSLMCSYWLLNSILGFYIVYQYPQLANTYPLTWLYLICFSAKWVLAGIIALIILTFICIILKLCYRAQNICENTIGAYPVLYIMIITISYMISFYYGVIIMKEIYLYRQSTNQDENNGSSIGVQVNNIFEDYKFQDMTQSVLIQVFVMNEIIVGATIIISFITSLCCGQLKKSKHLQEIEGEGFGIDEEIVKRVQQELQESRVRTESIRKDLPIGINDPIRLSQIKEDMIKEIIQETQNNRNRSVSQDPYAGGGDSYQKSQSINYGESPQQQQKQSISPDISILKGQKRNL